MTPVRLIRCRFSHFTLRSELFVSRLICFLHPRFLTIGQQSDVGVPSRIEGYPGRRQKGTGSVVGIWPWKSRNDRCRQATGKVDGLQSGSRSQQWWRSSRLPGTLVSAVSRHEDLGDSNTVSTLKRRRNQRKSLLFVRHGARERRLGSQIRLCDSTSVPQTSNGEYLRKEFKDRWELADNTTVPYHVYQLLKFFGSGDDLQVDCILHDQLYMYADKHANDCGFTWSSHKDFEENKIMPAMTFLSVVPGLIGTPAAHADEPLFYHKESGLVISGHQLEFQYLSPKVPFPEDLKQQGGFFYTTIVPKMFFVYGRFTSSLGETMTRLLDPKVHAAQYQEAMKWNFSYIATCHDIPTICGPLDNPEIMEGEGGLKGHLQRELGRTGEWTGEGVPGSWWPWRSPNIVYKVIQSEPKFVASMGPAPPLPLGGPGYDEIGMKK